jgi:hypothetical protein
MGLKLPILLLVVGVVAVGCSDSRQAGSHPSRKLKSVVIQEEKLEGSPKEIVAQLNTLARKYDTPAHQGVVIRFDPAVDAQCCSLGIFRRGEPLRSWLQAVCDACGSRYRIESGEVVIELLALSETRTANLEAHLPQGMAELCQQFRSKRWQERYTLGEELLRLLPHLPVTSKKFIGSGTIVTYDHEHPTYKLYRRDILAILGEPDRNSNFQKLFYSLREDEHRLWELEIDFGKYGYAENPNVIGASRK